MAFSSSPRSRLFPLSYANDLSTTKNSRFLSSPAYSPPDQRSSYIGPSHEDLSHSNGSLPFSGFTLSTGSPSDSIERQRSGGTHSSYAPRPLKIEHVSSLDEFVTAEDNGNDSIQLRDTIELPQPIEKADKDAVSSVLSGLSLNTAVRSVALAGLSSPLHEHLAGLKVSVGSSDQPFRHRFIHRRVINTHFCHERQVQTNPRKVPSMDACRSMRTGFGGYIGRRSIRLNTQKNRFISRSKARAGLDPSSVTEQRRRVARRNAIVALNINQ